MTTSFSILMISHFDHSCWLFPFYMSNTFSSPNVTFLPLSISQDDSSSVISFTSSVRSLPQQSYNPCSSSEAEGGGGGGYGGTSTLGSAASSSSLRRRHREDIEGKIECVEAMSALMGCRGRDADAWARRVEAMSATPANCELLRSSRTLDEIVQALHGTQVR